ncbi:MAG: UDP-2,3-diacylglucosamine diphosphatase [Candidatus Azobacteroides sp.]|nr:UDP-2,3-diacylglucosamine diphosphatase [Candidatus Azobacteroides sp.]
MAKKKIYFASDAHLGAKTIKHPREHELKIVRWLESIKKDAFALYLMGDMLDFWFEYKKVVPRGFTRFFGKLAELSDAGVEVHWFIGNHDMWIFDYIPEEMGVFVHRKPEIITLSGKKFFLAHGDGLTDKSLSFRFIRSVFHNKICQWLFSGIHPRWTIGLAHAWSRYSRESSEHNGYMGEENEYLVTYSKNYLKTHPDIQYFVFGHRHIVLDLKIAADSRVIILGDWIEEFSYAIFDGENIVIDFFNMEE